MTSTVPALDTLSQSLRPVRAGTSRKAGGSTLQAVFLDMDGTLVDTEGFWWDVEVEVFASSATPSTTPGATSWSAAP